MRILTKSSSIYQILILIAQHEHLQSLLHLQHLKMIWSIQPVLSKNFQERKNYLGFITIAKHRHKQNKHHCRKWPGILSDLSPTRATTSTNCEGFRVPYFSAKSSIPNDTILNEKIYRNPSFQILSVLYSNWINTYSKPRGAIRRRRKEGDRIWKKSLSGETTRTCNHCTPSKILNLYL